MSEFPQEIDLHRTPHVLFEIGSMLLFACSLLFVPAAVTTVAITYLIGGFPALVGLASVAFGLLAILGLGLVY